MNYLKIDKEDICNGDGLRVVLWLSGCSHKCKGCQNPQTWDANSGIPFDESTREELFRELDKDYISGLTLTGGDPLFESNLDGVLDLVTEVNKRYNQNVFQNAEMLLDRGRGSLPSDLSVNDKLFANESRLSSPKKSIWLYSGYTWEQLFDDDEFDIKGGICENQTRRAIVLSSDVFVDGQYIESQRDISLSYRGSSNQRLIDTQQSLEKGEIVLWQT